MKLEDILKRELDSIGDDHHSSNQENPIREDAFDVSDSEKIKLELTQNFGSNIKLNHKYDPSLISGAKLQIGSLMVEDTAKAKFNKILNNL